MLLVTRQELTDKAKKTARRVPAHAVGLPRPRCDVDAGRPGPRRGATRRRRPSARAGPSPSSRTPSTAPGSPGPRPGHALGQLGERFGIRELTDLDAALTLANDDGAKVRATLVARAETLRSERIADAEAAAAQATESMRFALIVMVFAFLAYELYPSVARLFAG